MTANGARNQLGYAVQLGTVRFLNCFLDNPEDTPAAVVDYVAEQLGLDPANLKGYGEKEARWDHQEAIRTAYGYSKLEDERWFALACWLYRRTWTTNERPFVLFDLATHRLVEARILLPGVTTLERLVSDIRERVSLRQYKMLAALPSPTQTLALEDLVTVTEGQRVSKLDRLRKSPTDVSGAGVAKALDRHVELRNLGAATWNMSDIPAGKVAALARFAKAARAKAVADLSGDRKLATLVAFAATMDPVSADEAIEVFDLAVSDLVRTSAFKADKNRLRTIKDLDTAAIVLREVWLKLRDTAADPDADLRAVLDQMDVTAIGEAADTIGEIAREPDEDFQDELMERYASVRRFLTKLLKVIDFNAGTADTKTQGVKRGFEVLEAIDFLKTLERRKTAVHPEEVPKAFLTSALAPAGVPQEGRQRWRVRQTRLHHRHRGETPRLPAPPRGVRARPAEMGRPDRRAAVG
ncbi:MAG: transposase Tn3 family protein [Actinomycetia bacterium]|nr:transposase Tn3 family protein [Actinomycetes bacterium]